ncbi:MAG: pyridoxal phosphate-dependent aminotransferase [Thermoplasmata archaeon]|nr:MAG: pyridoxal phosphate-dependent aminotransferase [Thermoplasmata archaeon]
MTKQESNNSTGISKAASEQRGSLQGAKRMQHIRRSATLKLAERAKELASSGKDIISLSMGEPDFTTPEHIIQAAKNALDEGLTHYTPALGIPELREAVTKHCNENNNIPAKAADIMILPTKLAVYNSMLAMVGPGDEVIIPEPAWVTYEPCVQLAQAKSVSIHLDADKDFRLIPDDLAEAITPKTKMLVLNSPCNPTGGVYSKSDIEGIAQLAVDHDIIVLTDEIYEKIIYEGQHYSIAAQPDMFERTITTSGFSKGYAMTGWRVGWVVAGPSIFSQLKKLQEHSITCATSFAQYGALAALNGPQDCVNEMVTEFKKRRDLVVEGLNNIDGFNCNKPKGTFYAFFSYEYQMNSNDFANYLLENAGVALTPGSGFGAAGEGFLRMSYAASQSQLKEGLGRIKKTLESDDTLKRST